MTKIGHKKAEEEAHRSEAEVRNEELFVIRVSWVRRRFEGSLSSLSSISDGCRVKRMGSGSCYVAGPVKAEAGAGESDRPRGVGGGSESESGSGVWERISQQGVLSLRSSPSIFAAAAAAVVSHSAGAPS
jgi:hypothetical protein